MTSIPPLPSSLSWLHSRKDGTAWLERLPTLFQNACDRWDLQISGQAFEGGVAGFVVPVERNHQPCVLKLQWPHPECEYEAAALDAWNGNGAVRLLEHDPKEHALLIERCFPGTYLADHRDVNAISIMATLLSRLSIKAHGPFRSLADEAADWKANLSSAWSKAGEPCERHLVDSALLFIDQLAGTQQEQVLVHQDLHGHNVLDASGGSWLAIDPKPVIGERAFSLAPIVRSFEFGSDRDATVARLDRLSSELDIDRDRALGWTVAQTMAWSFEGTKHLAQHHNTARWLLEAR